MRNWILSCITGYPAEFTVYSKREEESEIKLTGGLRIKERTTQLETRTTSHTTTVLFFLLGLVQLILVAPKLQTHRRRDVSI